MITGYLTRQSQKCKHGYMSKQEDLQHGLVTLKRKMGGSL